MKDINTVIMHERFLSKPDMPVNCYFDSSTRGSDYLTAAHWHEHIELLLVTQGILRVNVQGEWIEAAPGALVVINSGEIHSIPVKPADTLYACLIPHKALCAKMGIPVEEVKIEHYILDPSAAVMIREIFNVLLERPIYYKAEIQAKVISLIVYLAQAHGKPHEKYQNVAQSSKESMVKEAIAYIQGHFKESISTADISAYLGFDKSYVCNNFRTITGTTIVEYLNLLRCEYARDLLRTGELSVAQCAIQSGFHHMSYFTKTYRRYIGQLPSRTLQLAGE